MEPINPMNIRISIGYANGYSDIQLLLRVARYVTWHNISWPNFVPKLAISFLTCM